MTTKKAASLLRTAVKNGYYFAVHLVDGEWVKNVSLTKVGFYPYMTLDVSPGESSNVWTLEFSIGGFVKATTVFLKDEKSAIEYGTSFLKDFEEPR
jgi:hypothetical protein